MSDEVRFNVLNHVNVPLHTLLSEDEVKALLKQYGIVREQLPKIRNVDPVVQVLAKERSKKPEELAGSVVKIVRRSPTAGTAVAYRLIIEAI